MGKKTDEHIINIEAEIVKAELNAAVFAKGKENYAAAIKALKELCEKQAAVLKSAFNNDEIVAMANPKYAELEGKINDKEKELRRMSQKNDEYPAKINAAVKAAGAGLVAFEKFLVTKEGSTRLPWKKKSLSNSKEFVKKAKADLSKINVPPMPSFA